MEGPSEGIGEYHQQKKVKRRRRCKKGKGNTVGKDLKEQGNLEKDIPKLRNKERFIFRGAGKQGPEEEEGYG